MQFLLNIIVFYYNTPVFYKVSKITENEYFAEPDDKSLSSFKLIKKITGWHSEAGYYQRQVDEVGKRLDMFLNSKFSDKI